MERLDCVIVGAGVIGLACARALARAGREVVIMEREARFGAGLSSRNSEVIHAGIYYPPGSLKARFCVAGARALYAYCAERKIPHAKCGKLIVAAHADQAPRLEALQRRAEANGVAKPRLLSAAEAMRMEPALYCAAALHSPETGIFDSHQFMLALLADAEDAGAALALKTRLLSGRVLEDGVAFETLGADGADAPVAARADMLVNCAGLYAQDVAAAIEGLPARAVPKMRFAKGSYFSVHGGAPFSHLIYPLPDDGGLGAHVTFDLGGAARLGPDVEWDAARDDFAVDPARASALFNAARAYWPDLELSRLAPDYASVRPKLSGPGAAPADFRIDGPDIHGARGVVNLFGIESPGLTAALAIADCVAALAQRG